MSFDMQRTRDTGLGDAGVRDRAALDAFMAAALATAQERFTGDDLAFLAATSKIELPVRDAFALELHRALAPLGYLVAREWLRTDVAVLADTEPPVPLVLVELKAMYSFDALDLTSMVAYTARLAADETKAMRLAQRDTAVYTILLATHCDRRVPARYKGIVKYAGSINSAHARHDVKVRERAIAATVAALEGFRLVSHGVFDAGRAFECGFEVLYWLMKVDSSTETLGVSGKTGER